MAGWSAGSRAGSSGAPGRKGSRNLIFVFTRSFILAFLGSASMLLLPRALGPHSNRPWNQPVHQDTNPKYHRLIQRFGEATGVPVLMNTSFNVRGEPIVNSPGDALNTFANSGIDTLVMGDFLVDKP